MIARHECEWPDRKAKALRLSPAGILEKAMELSEAAAGVRPLS